MLKRNKYIFLLLVAVVILGAAFRVVLSYLSINNLPPSSDDAIAQLLARSISKGESLPLLFTGQPYQFPIEAYLMSVFVDWFEPGSFAARIQLIVIGIVTLVLLCITAVKVFKLHNRWPTLILLLVPSAYWLVHQSGYFVPQYTVSALFAALMFYLAININKSENSSFTATLLIGLIYGLAISNHLLMLSVVLGSFAIIVVCGDLKRSLVRVGAICIGLAVGLIPYLLAVFTIEGAYDAITSRTDLGILFNRFYNIVISQALPGAMGIYPPYYPDYPVHISWGVPLRILFVTSFLLILLSSIFIRMSALFNQIGKGTWPKLAWPDMFILISLFSLVLMAINTRSQGDDHRYVLAAVWSFPFLVGYLYTAKKLYWLIGGYALFLVGINILTTIDLLNEWSQPGKIQHHADTENIDEVVNWMQGNDIQYCYATFWLAYRFSYETDEKIICAPVYNERFNGWPIPYKEQVDNQQKIAFVMSNTYGTKFSSRKFETLMNQYNVEYKRKIYGSYFIYYDFYYKPGLGEISLPAQHFEISTNIEDVDVASLIDKDVTKAWSMKESQQPGQYVDFEFKQKQYVQKLDIVHPLKNPYPAQSVKILGRKADVWIPLTKTVLVEIDRLRFENNHPIFGEYLQVIRFAPQWLDAVRVELVEPDAGKPWTLSEIRVGIQAQH